jgi:glycosyltransferase involved in cell wall biosynthesis
VHIDRFARAAFERFGGGLLYVLGGEGLPPYRREDGDVEIVRFSHDEPHLLPRALHFGARLDELAGSLELCHFRDPWSGLPIVERAGAGYATVYEVNGLPSIELPFLYPAIPPATLERVAELEQRCLDRADAVVAPARTIAQGCAPLKLLESMASGTPVVASDLPAVRELVADAEHGRLVHPDRPSELARAIRVLLDYPDRLAAMGPAARAHVASDFTWEAATRTLQDLYNTLSPQRDRMRSVSAT